MQLQSIALKGFKKHSDAVFYFSTGSNLIIGPNYSGKSSVIEAILVGLWGSSAVPLTTKDLIGDNQKDYLITVTLQSDSKGVLVVERSSKDASITQAGAEKPYVVGHTAVTKEISEMFGVDRSVFMKLFTSVQGSPQQLLDMEGTELTRFIESLLGLDKLDEILKTCMSNVREAQAGCAALESMVLSPETVAGLENNKEVNSGFLAKQEPYLAKLKEQVEILSAEKAVLVNQLNQAFKIEADYQQRKNEQALYEGLLASNPAVENVIDPKPYEQKVVTLSSDLEKLKADWHTINEENKKYTLNQSLLKGVTDDLEALVPVQLIPEAQLIRLTSERNFLSADQAKLLEQKAHAESAIKALDKLKLELNQARDQTEGKGYVTVPDATAAQDVLTEVVDRLKEMQAEETRLRDTLHNSACPTCKRPFTASTDLAQIEEQLASIVEKVAEQKSVYTESLALLAEAKSAHDAAVKSNAELSALYDKELGLKERLDAQQLAVDKFRDLDSYAEEIFVNDEKLVEFNDSLKKWYEQNVKAHTYLERYDTLTEQLKALKASTAVYTDPAPTEKKLKKVEADLANATTRLAQVKADYSHAASIALQRESWRKELDIVIALLAETTVPNTRELSAQLEEVNGNLIESKDSAGKTENSVIMARTELKDAEDKLSKHYLVQSRIEQYLKTASIYEFLRTLILNKRPAFIRESVDTLFGVVTDFCKTVTNGDIEEVGLVNGAIAYKENDRWRPSSSASGAQKSLIGLGMKIGLSEVVKSEWDTLLLDEVSAAMDEEISQACVSALEMYAPSAIVVSHRAFDTASNVIALTGDNS